MRHEIKVAVYDLAVLIAKQQPRGYVTEDVYCYQRHIEDAINRAWSPLADDSTP